MIQQEKTAQIGAPNASDALLKAATILPTQHADVSALRIVRVRAGEFRLEYIVNVDPIDARREQQRSHKLPRRSVLEFERRRVEDLIREQEATLVRLRARLATIDTELRA